MLIVETGQLEPGANSYASVEQADAYHAARGTEAWPQYVPEPEPEPEVQAGALEEPVDSNAESGTDTDTDTGTDTGADGDAAGDSDVAEVDPNLSQKEASLIRATDVINGFSYPGTKAKPGRVLAWPRINAYDLCDGDEMPTDCVPEAIVMATCYLAGAIMDGQEPQEALARGGRTQSESVSSLSESYFPDAANRTIYAAVADLLKCIAFGFSQYAGVGDNAAGKAGFVQGRVVL